MTLYDETVEALFRRELVGQPAGDPGGDTVLGISMRSHPPSRGALEAAFWARVATVRETHGDLLHDPETRLIAARIYRLRYWDECRCSELPPALRVCVFDCAVNQGAGVAIRLLQRALRVKADGIIGTGTIGAAHQVRDVLAVARNFMARRAKRYSETAGYAAWGVGWHDRLFEVYGTAYDVHRRDA